VYFVLETAQVELKSGRVQAPALRPPAPRFFLDRVALSRGSVN